MLRVGVVGATGYAGEELVRILIRHPQVKITSLTAKLEKPQDIAEIFPGLLGRISMVCENLDIEKVVNRCDLVFLALPHRVSMEVAPQMLEADKKVIDLSADYRLKDASVYENWYNTKHKSQEYLAQAIYGQPELYREGIKTARLIANPGCYPTGIILGSAPLVKEDLVEIDWIIVDSKSGLTGAGRGLVPSLQFSEANENLKAYKINVHQHIPEIDQELSRLADKKVHIIFTPHAIPMNRGILSTIYFRLKSKISLKEVLSLYRGFYEDEPFVRVLAEGDFPETKDVFGTNYCDIGIKVDEKMELCIVIATLDNLVKGASGQAVQNMNIMYGFDERMGLI